MINILDRGQQRYKRITAVWLLCIVMILSAACGKKNSDASDDSSEAETSSSGSAAAGTDDERIRIGFVVKENGRDHWIRMKEAAEQCCEENDAELLFLTGSSDTTAAEQIAEIDGLIEEKADAICVSPISDEMVYAALTRADDAGIPVFAIDTDTSFQQRIAYIGTDNYTAAKEGAVYATGQIRKSGNAVILRGTPGDSVHDERTEGIIDGLNTSGAIVCRTLCTSAEEAGNDVQRLLQELPDLDLVITTEDEITLAVWKRVLALGNTSVRIYGFDGTEEVASLTEKYEQVLGTTAQFPEEVGVRAIQTVLDYLNNGSTETSVKVPHEIITPENAAEYCAELSDNQYKAVNKD